jgi:hypothetical protein
MRSLIDWLPLVVLVAIWLLFMWLMMRKNSPNKLALAELRRHNDVLEKLLAQHDERLHKLEGGKEGR